jgi:hypothetical protein
MQNVELYFTFIIVAVILFLVIKKSDLKSGKDIFTIYHNSFFYRLVGILIATLLALLIVIIKRS